MLKDFKPDMPSVLALIILALFAFASVFNMLASKTGTLDADFKQTLFAITMVAIGYFLGSSTGSAKKTDALMAHPAPAPVTATTVTDASTLTDKPVAPPAPSL